jgi:replicative DNA helicase
VSVSEKYRHGRGKPEHAAPAIVAGRVPPHDLDAEACVLSACLLDRHSLDVVLEILKPEHFYSDANGKIFEAAQELSLASQPVDSVTVAGWLRDRERLAQVGGASYIARITDATPTVAHVDAHARRVYEKWRVRQLIATCQRVSAEGYGDYGDEQEFIDGAEQAIFELAHGGRKKATGAPIALALHEAFKQITEAAERGDRITGISTGYERLDAKTAGLHAGDLTIVAARPGMGKTSLVLNIATNVAAPRAVLIPDSTQPGGKREVQGSFDGALVFTLEMPIVQLAQRMACSEGRVDLGKLRQGYLQPDDWRRLTEAASFLSSLPVWLEFTPGLTLQSLRASIRRYKAQFDREATADTPEKRIRVVVVDYLQIMKGRDGAGNREQEISEISRGLKILAGEFDVAVVALSQLNRAVETRTTKDKRPQLSDLRESGAIEQDADNVIFVYRDEYYNPETTNAKGIAELIIAKQRNGPPGKVLTRFTASCTRFDDLAAGDYPELENE